MNKINYLFFMLAAVVVFSCTKDDDTKSAPIRDRSTQYASDIDSLDKYLDTHYMTVDGQYNVSIASITDANTQVSIRNQTDFPLQNKIVTDATNNIDYKVYYIKLAEGEGQNPSSVDSIYTSYKGNLLSGTQFDSAQVPIWLQLDNVITGWREIFPLFKTGSYDENTPEGEPEAFNGYGAGVMFLPSGLAYYNQVTSGIPSYSPLVFNFKLFSLKYKDQDKDGILSKDEVAAAGDDPLKYDSDGDGVPNMYDTDDDGDTLLTKTEINKNPDGTIIFEDCDNDGIPNYLDPDVCQ